MTETKRIETVVDSPGVSNLSADAPADPLTVALPQIGGLASTIHRLVQEGLTIDQMAQKLARFVDPGLVPALQTLATVLQAVEHFLPKGEAPSGEHGGE
jgi:hypothetical protein